MKLSLLLIVMVLLAGSDETKSSKHKPTLKSFKLKGNVEYLSEKRMHTKLTGNEWETLQDSSDFKVYKLSYELF